jgi:hypothetical protein
VPEAQGGPGGRSVDGSSKSKPKKSARATPTTTSSAKASSGEVETTPGESTPIPDPEKERSDKIMRQFEKGDVKSIMEVPGATTSSTAKERSTGAPEVPEDQGSVGRSFGGGNEQKREEETTPKEIDSARESDPEAASTAEQPQPTSRTHKTPMSTRKPKTKADYDEMFNKAMKKQSKQSAGTKSKPFSEEVDSYGNKPTPDPEKDRSDKIMRQFENGNMKSFMEVPSFEQKPGGTPPPRTKSKEEK